VPGQWVTVTYDLSATPLNIAAVSQLGLQINTSAASQCTGPLLGDGGTTDAPVDAGAADAPVDAGAADAPVRG
jgi:hypothetical protein